MLTIQDKNSINNKKTKRKTWFLEIHGVLHVPDIYKNKNRLLNYETIKIDVRVTFDGTNRG